MKGLILKDFLIFIKQLKFQLVIIFFMVLFTVGTAVDADAASFLPALAYLTTSTLPITLISLDESYKWNVTMLSMPYTRSMYVTAKYIVGIALLLLCSILFFAALSIGQLIHKPFILSECVSSSATSAAAAILIQGITLPFIFKLGVEKGRLVYAAFIGACTAITMNVLNSNIAVPYIRASHSVLLFVLSAVLYVLSWLLSKAIYEKREIV